MYTHMSLMKATFETMPGHLNKSKFFLLLNFETDNIILTLNLLDQEELRGFSGQY